MNSAEYSARVMDVLAVHRRIRYSAHASTCSCGWGNSLSDIGAYEYDRHLADAIAQDISSR